tara:strand:+ start:276 stop:557 length:282 start_codon:yes stop_codon:yes gene_type:complete
MLNKTFSLCSFMGVSKKIDTSISMSETTALILTTGLINGWVINHYLLKLNDLFYLRTVIFVVVIALVVQLTEILIRGNSPFLYKILGVVQSGR